MTIASCQPIVAWTARCRAALGASLALAAIVIGLLGASFASAAEPLPSWADGPTRSSILDFVAKVTAEGGSEFVPVPDRIAVFDNDGTLWSEQPVYFQIAFALDRVKALAPTHPEWATTEPFKSILAGDLAGLVASGQTGIMELLAATHAGMTSVEFTALVTDWFATARHPRFQRPYDEIVFQPMVELLAYLRENGFKTFIVSGGGIEFMRPMTERAYGVPPEQVIGSSIVTRYELDGDVPVLRRDAKINFIDDGAGKPVGINEAIGHLPILAVGNSDGDYEMLRWVTAGKGPRYGLIIHHTDAAREWAYDRQSKIGKLDKALTEAPSRGWTVVDMKADWKRIYAFDH